MLKRDPDGYVRVPKGKVAVCKYYPSFGTAIQAFGSGEVLVPPGVKNIVLEEGEKHSEEGWCSVENIGGEPVWKYPPPPPKQTFWQSCKEAPLSIKIFTGAYLVGFLLALGLAIKTSFF